MKPTLNDLMEAYRTAAVAAAKAAEEASDLYEEYLAAADRRSKAMDLAYAAEQELMEAIRGEK
jgi:hypothetical protein